jgi:hypothetical protein
MTIPSGAAGGLRTVEDASPKAVAAGVHMCVFLYIDIRGSTSGLTYVCAWDKVVDLRPK